MTQQALCALQKIAKAALVPALAYAYAKPKEKNKDEFESNALAVGQKNILTIDTSPNSVDNNTLFPASSLSKIVFTYLVLQLVIDKQIDLDEPLHEILQYERFLVNGEYPEKATKLTARHVLSHTTGLPNFGGNFSSRLVFNPNSKLGDGYAYSGEAFLYLQKVIETKMGKDLETLAKEYVFTPLGMERSTFLPPQEGDTNIVAVHTELGKPTSIYVGEPYLNAASSLLTTACDFSKFLAAWLENRNDPIIKQSFEPTSAGDFQTCGLGWHIYRNRDEVIAYQYGENPNTRSFVAINLTNQKGAAFFTNSENGMSIANQLFSSPDLVLIGNMQVIYEHMHYSQSDEPGWKEMIAGKMAQEQGKLEEARAYFGKALELSPNDEAKQRRLEWFNEVHQSTPGNQTFTQPLETFVGKLRNPYNDEVEIFIKDGSLIYEQFGQEIKLVRISETDFLPQKDQSFKISFNTNKVSISFVHGGLDKFLFKECLPTTQLQYKEAVSQLRESPGFCINLLNK